MAAALPWIATGLAAGSAVMQVNSARDARRASRENARMAAQEAQEEERRLRMEQSERESITRATIAASGTGMGSDSQMSFLDKMRKEHSAELAWLQKSGSSRVRAERRAGDLAYRQGIAGAIGTAAGAASTGYSFFGPQPKAG